MRRKEKAINNWEEIESIIKSEKICRIGLADGGIPYIVPVNYGYKDKAIYIHSACSGRKIEIIKKNNLVCFEIESEVKIIPSEIACKWDTIYTSVIGYGKAEIIQDREGVIKGLDIIMEQQSGKKNWEYDKNRLKKTTIIRIDIESIEAKKNS